MTRFSIYTLNESARARNRELVARLLSRTESADEFRCLIDDLFSANEVAMFARRLIAMHMLEEGRGWREVRKALGCSADLIRDASTRLARGGKSLARTVERLRTIIAEMREEMIFAERSEKPETPEGMARRYPGYFWEFHAALAAPREARNFMAARKRKKNLKKKS